MSSPLRSIIPIAVILIALVVLAVVVALVAAPEESGEFAADSPEGTVQRYLQAVRDREIDRAYEMLSSRVREDVSREDFRRFTQFNGPADEVQRVRIEGVDQTSGGATVRLAVDRVSGSGINASRYSVQHVVPLIREDDEWKIDDPFTAIASRTGMAAT